MTEAKELSADTMDQLRTLALGMGVDAKTIENMTDDEVLMNTRQIIAEHAGDRASPHWKDLQSEEDKNARLAKAEAKRERKRLKKTRYTD